MVFSTTHVESLLSIHPSNIELPVVLLIWNLCYNIHQAPWFCVYNENDGGKKIRNGHKREYHVKIGLFIEWCFFFLNSSKFYIMDDALQISC